ncbi:hypothetical protein B0H12DRAFT_388790 [Mycena haematopus]|nr:hypothetical protein B0H12DRAFT_388790 [Mycena haematopus]
MERPCPPRHTLGHPHLPYPRTAVSVVRIRIILTHTTQHTVFVILTLYLPTLSRNPHPNPHPPNSHHPRISIPFVLSSPCHGSSGEWRVAFISL